MMTCWSTNPEYRLSFSGLRERLFELLDNDSTYINFKA